MRVYLITSQTPHRVILYLFLVYRLFNVFSADFHQFVLSSTETRKLGFLIDITTSLHPPPIIPGKAVTVANQI